MAASGDPGEVQWNTAAKDLQQIFYNHLGDREWDIIEKGEKIILLQKVAYGIYGSPPKEPTKDNQFTGYEAKQLELVEKICKQLTDINEGNSKIYFSCIFIVGNKSKALFIRPVFRTIKEKDESSVYFVDTDCHIYPSWSDYLKNNTLPEGFSCVPRDGHYIADENDNILVDFLNTTARGTAYKKGPGSNTLVSVVTLGATYLGLQALCGKIPIAGPIVAEASPVNLGLDSLESIGKSIIYCGFYIGSVLYCMLSYIKRSATAGEVMGEVGRETFDALKGMSLTVNGFGVTYGLAVLVDKSVRNELTSLDVAQFSASCLFFNHALVNSRTALTIIKEVQHDVIKQEKSGLSDAAKKLFNKHTGQLRGPDEMHGNALVIKTLIGINNRPELYEIMAHPDVNSRKVKLYADGLRGLLNVNKQFKVHPNKYLEMGPETRQQILDATQQLRKDPTKEKEFKAKMTKICRENRIKFECMRQEAVENLCKAFGEDNVKDIVINSKRLFFDMKPHDIDRVAVVLSNAGKNYNPKMLELVIKFSESHGCKTISDFCSFMEYSSYYVREMKIKSEADYNAKLVEAKKAPGFNAQKFNDAYGIIGKRNVFFEQKALSDLLEEGNSAFKEMTQHFEFWKEAVVKANSQIDPRFHSENAATYHYLKHQDFGPAGNLSVDQYFKIASDLVGDPRNQTNSMLSQDGTCTMITLKNPLNGAFGVRIDRIQEGEVVSGIATVFYVKDEA